MQIELFPETGEKLANQGIKKAINHAEKDIPGWATLAFECLKSYLRYCPPDHEFMAEDVRKFSQSTYFLPEPPNLRAWGGIMRRAQRAGLIRAIGTRKVVNPTAHCANATLWIKK